VRATTSADGFAERRPTRAAEFVEKTDWASQIAANPFVGRTAPKGATMVTQNQTVEDVRAPVSKRCRVELGDKAKRDANALMVSGAGIGVLGAVAAAIGGAVCPVCVVAAPALLGIGVFRRWRARQTRSASP